MLPKEWRRGPVLEPAGTLAMTRKMLLLASADSESLRCGGLLQLQCFFCSGLLGRHSNEHQQCCALQIFCEPLDQRVMQSLCHHQLRCRCCRRVGDAVPSCLRGRL